MSQHAGTCLRNKASNLVARVKCNEKCADRYAVFYRSTSSSLPSLPSPSDRSVVLRKSIESLTLITDFVRKVVQLYETTLMRSGLMLVGPTSSGKTKVSDQREISTAPLAWRDLRRISEERARRFLTISFYSPRFSRYPRAIYSRQYSSIVTLLESETIQSLDRALSPTRSWNFAKVLRVAKRFTDDWRFLQLLEKAIIAWKRRFDSTEHKNNLLCSRLLYDIIFGNFEFHFESFEFFKSYVAATFIRAANTQLRSVSSI